MDGHALARAVRARALALGFDKVGFCEALPPAEIVHFDAWLDAGMHAEMEWLRRGRNRRADPGLGLRGARSFVVVALSYAPPSLRPEESAGDQPLPGRGFVARYARGEDYHHVMGRRLLELERFIEGSAPGHRALSYVDTGPFLERLWAARAGIGWIGKNALVLNETMGSFFLLGLVVTTLELPPDEPALDRCGRCTLCLDACPTGAIPAPRVVDSRRCIAYQTIERRGPIPEAERDAVGWHVFGCDDCQTACPWNRQGEQAGAAGIGSHLAPRAGAESPSLVELLALSRQDYIERFRGSAIKRATWPGLRRNAALALAASPPRDPGQRRDAVTALRLACGEDEDPAVREQAAWSLAALARRR
ncbi:MAG TPA: tRNA epoxyqueuosine(34) reductase QueG [Candidatus Polarisedimenticolia bacterium]|nr:tRNA epoxyqueuosine(34) reductase QueG [Candidatus Polarisedimenticolia bacterium]